MHARSVRLRRQHGRFPLVTDKSHQSSRRNAPGKGALHANDGYTTQMLHATSVKDNWKNRPKVRQKNSAKFGVSKCLSCCSMFVRRLPLVPYKSMSTHVDLHLNVFQNAVNGPQSSHTSSPSPRRHARECLAKNFDTFGALTSSRAPPTSSERRLLSQKTTMSCKPSATFCNDGPTRSSTQHVTASSLAVAGAQSASNDFPFTTARSAPNPMPDV